MSDRDNKYPTFGTRDEIDKTILGLTSTILNLLASNPSNEDKIYAENHTAFNDVLANSLGAGNDNFIKLMHSAVRNSFSFGQPDDFLYLQHLFNKKMPGVATNRILSDMFFGRSFTKQGQSKIDDWVTLVSSNPSTKSIDDWIQFIEKKCGRTMLMNGTYIYSSDCSILSSIIDEDSTIDKFELILTKHMNTEPVDISKILTLCLAYNRIDIMGSIFKNQNNWLMPDTQPTDINDFQSCRTAITAKFNFIISSMKSDNSEFIQWATEHMFNPSTEKWMIATLQEMAETPDKWTATTIGSMLSPTQNNQKTVQNLLTSFEKKSLTFESFVSNNDAQIKTAL